MEDEDAYLVAQGVTVGCGLAGGGFEGDGEVPGVGVSDLGGRGKAEDVGGFVFAAEGFVEAAEGGVVGEQNFDFAGRPTARRARLRNASPEPESAGGLPQD